MKNDVIAAAGPPVAMATQFDLLGKLSWLWMSSSLHREWSVESVARFLLPPIALGQVQILERENMPVAYCSWAWFDEASEIRYLIDPSQVEAADWNSGDRLWFADWIAPFGAADSWQLRKLMAARFPDQVARAIRVKRDSKKARVMEFKGPKLATSIGRARLKRYYDEFFQMASPAMPVPQDSLAASAAGSEIEARNALVSGAAPGRRRFG